MAEVLHLHVGGQVIRTTGEHPFYVIGQGWVPARELVVGDLLCSHDGQQVSVEDVLETGEYETVYNFRVADYHTYYVGCDEWGFSVWAHNARCVNPQAIAEVANVKGTVKDRAARIMRNKNESAAIEYLSKAKDLSGNLVGVEKAKLALEASKKPIALNDPTKVAQVVNVLGAQYEIELVSTITANGNKPFFRTPRRGGIDIGSLEGRSIIINEAKLVTPPNRLQFDDFTAINANLKNNLTEMLTHVKDPKLTPMLTSRERGSVIGALDTFLSGKSVPNNLKIRVTVKTPGGVMGDVIGSKIQSKVSKHASGIPVQFVQG